MGPKLCACGWERPVISITTREGTPPREDLIPVYTCPRCGQHYMPDEISPDVAQRILRAIRSSRPNSN
jgi:hypothetical protein